MFNSLQSETGIYHFIEQQAAEIAENNSTLTKLDLGVGHFGNEFNF